TIIENGYIRSNACASPQPYETVDGSETGWACFDQASGLWILHAPGPSGAGVSSHQPAVLYSRPNTVYVPSINAESYPYYTYSYPYPYYSYPWGYSYPYYGFAPGLGLGFAFGFGNGYGHFGHGYYGGHGFRGPVVAH